MLEKREKKKRLIRALIMLSLTLIFIGILTGLYFGLGYHKTFNDPEALKALINANPKTSYLVFILINFIQTAILPIPNFITIVVGTQLYGAFLASVLTFIGVFSGSMVAFGMARLLGKKAIDWIVGKETVDKYLQLFKGREKFVITSMLLLPGFPDDILCFIAGLTNMSWKFFIISVLVCRPIPLIINANLAEIIPLNGWGIAIWTIIIIVVVVIGRLITRNWDDLSDKFHKIFSKK